MKKLISVLLVIVLMCGILAPQASAAGTGNLSMEEVNAKRGETVTLKVNLGSNPGLVTMTIRVKYDTSVLELTKVVDEGVLVGSMLSNNYKTPYQIAWVDGAATVNNVATGTIATFTFKVKDDAAFGKSVVTLEFVDSFDVDMNMNSFTAKSGSVTVVCEHSYGSKTNVDGTNHKQVCSKCGGEKLEAHSWGTGVETTPATCQKTGVKTYTCSGCGATKTEDISKKPHTWGSWTKVDDNQHKRTCTACKTETETSAHRWDSGKVTKEATCKDTGVKTYTCSVCNGTKTETIPVDPTAHKFENKWSKFDDNQHQSVCTVCKTEKKLENHKWNNGEVTKEATCKDTGVKTYTCSVCNGTKTETVPVDPNAHSFGAWTKLDNDKHERTCTICKTEKERENHNKQNGMVTKAATCVAEGEKTYTCSVCSGTTVEKLPVDPAAHKLGDWANLDADKHAQSCTLCSTVQKQENHKWESKVTKDSTCKEVGVKTYTCVICKATKTEEIPVKPHTFGKWESISDTQHKRTCTMCKTETETVDHKFTEGDNWSKDEKQHYHVCECGMKKDAADHVPGPEPTEKDPQICTVCKYIIKPALGHTHTWDTKLTTDETGHWYDCPGCEDKKDFKEHDFANDCDGLCETCQYTRTTEHKFGTEWASDETGHFHACSVCGEKIDFAEHTPGEEATEETAQTCTVCAYEVTPALGHTHVFAEEWKHDGQGHWHECVCGEKADEAGHTWADGVCAVCGGVQPLEVPDEAGFPWVIVIIAVLGVGAVAAAVILLKKKKK